MRIVFRPAVPSDASQVVPLVRSAGPAAIEYGFASKGASASDFLGAGFARGSGFFGYRVHEVALLDGSIAAVAASYCQRAYVQMAVAHSWMVWRWFPGVEFGWRIRRCLALQALMPPPSPGMFYFANFGVAGDLRGCGIGRQILDRHIDRAARARFRRFALDVSVDNAVALTLYERCGLQIVGRNRFPGPPGLVPDSFRMELKL